MPLAKDNDHISKLAAERGFQSWKTLWDANKGLKRATPNQLFKGNRLDGNGADRYTDPPKSKEKDAGETGKFNAFTIPGEELFIRLRILKDDYTAAANCSFELVIPGLPDLKGKTDDKGHIKAPILKNTTTGTLTIRVKQETAAATSPPPSPPPPEGGLKGEVPIVWDLRIGALNPICEMAPDQYCVSGVQQRLNNININTALIDGINGPNTSAAITSFQELAEISDSVTKGVPDKAKTQEKLRKVHDGPTPVHPKDA